ncbi:MAG: DUF1385 domain-containing protein [Candidatus Nanoarchaeia archaeon]
MKKIPAGGQAVIEGVMMKTPRYYSVAVRNEKGRIVTTAARYVSLGEKYPFLKLPFLRGVINLWEMLRLGMKSLGYSAKVAGEEDEELSDTAVTVTIIFSVFLAIGLFVVLPYFVTHLFGISEEKNTIMFNLVDGIIKLLLFVGYVYAISFMKDIRRVFQYHGAEHMAVNTYEAGKELTLNNSLKHGTYHPRCGTSFVVFVLIVMVLVFSFIPMLIKGIFPGIDSLSIFARKLLFFGVRLLFIIPVAGISYELLRLSGKMKDNLFSKIIGFPGRLVQGITTREPEKDQVKVAISALKKVLKKESEKAD